MTDTDLNKHEFGCLVMRECGAPITALGFDHPNHCRFCAGVLFSSRELREAGMILDDNGRPIPKEDN